MIEFFTFTDDDAAAGGSNSGHDGDTHRKAIPGLILPQKCCPSTPTTVFGVSQKLQSHSAVLVCEDDCVAEGDHTLSSRSRPQRRGSVLEQRNRLSAARVSQIHSNAQL